MLNKNIVTAIMSTQYLDLDYTLAHLGITHAELREWCHANNHDMPPVTEDLRLEMAEYTRKEACEVFHLSLAEYDYLHYRDFTPLESSAKLRAQGHTELLIGQVCGTRAYDAEYLSKELQERRNGGARVIDLAEMYNISHSRVSQLTLASRPYKRLSDEAREDIRTSPESAAYLAKKYGVALNTVYVIRRSA